jgi:carboxypeptidase Q
MPRRFFGLLVLAAITPGIAARPAVAAESPTIRIAGAALAGGGAYDLARGLADGVGARPSGSPAAERATVWAETAMRRIGLDQVRREPVKVQTWVRGEEAAALTAPTPQPLTISALGGSVATPGEGLEAEVVEVDSLESLRLLGARAAGKIVVVNKPMEHSQGYAAASAVRQRAASEAARLGAVAALVRSAGTGHHRLAHTGAMRYEAGVARIPTAALAAEDADLIHRLLAAGGPVKLRLRLTAHAGGEANGWNVVGELRGRGKPEEIVLIGCHLDSWDVGTGALDDAAGCGIALDTARVMVALGLRPRRTLRVVLFTNEEMGGAGAQAYVQAHQTEIARHVAALEADSGAGRPRGYRVAAAEPALAAVRRWVQPLGHLVPVDVRASASVGADLNPLLERGVPGLGISQDQGVYFEWHHTQGDTLDKIDPLELALATAAFASLTWAVADTPERLPGLPPGARRGANRNPRRLPLVDLLARPTLSGRGRSGAPAGTAVPRWRHRLRAGPSRWVSGSSSCFLRPCRGHSAALDGRTDPGRT